MMLPPDSISLRLCKALIMPAPAHPLGYSEGPPPVAEAQGRWRMVTYLKSKITRLGGQQSIGGNQLAPKHDLQLGVGEGATVTSRQSGGALLVVLDVVDCSGTGTAIVGCSLLGERTLRHG